MIRIPRLIESVKTHDASYFVDSPDPAAQADFIVFCLIRSFESIGLPVLTTSTEI